MLFTTATGYALRALAALPEDGSYCLAKDLASSLELPGPYLAKILQGLVQADILESVRGPKGGFRLVRPAHRITVGEVVVALEGPNSMDGCVMGFPTCSGDHPCPLHDAWGAVKAQVASSMTEATIRDLQLMDLRNLKESKARNPEGKA
ncbi:Rrf2 family transcriptional regulator [Geothrix sp.]|jgi:Rrf2 family protein|uniref:RrF2 family transcriptional regulator n=1 Tax=Geothrix sp. TaxID=1962974 RepID=UPI0025C3A185|nr:Rrf2 family transcriptional regulator [Geothrix sp.]